MTEPEPDSDRFDRVRAMCAEIAHLMGNKGLSPAEACSVIVILMASYTVTISHLSGRDLDSVIDGFWTAYEFALDGVSREHREKQAN